MAYKLAPDWFYVEAANFAGKNDVFPSLEIAKEVSEKYKKEANLKGKEYKENIFATRCLPPGEYFVGDPAAVIEDYEDNDKWPCKADDVFQLDDGTFFALYHANLGPGEYIDEEKCTFRTESGDIIIIPIEKINKEEAVSLAENGEACIFFSKLPFDTGKDRQCEGSIDFGGYPVIFTDHEMWFDDEE